MNQNDPILNEVADLLSHSLEGDLTPERFEYFKNLLQKDPRARAYYYRLLTIYATLQEAESILVLQDDASEATFQEALNALSIEEKTAPAIDVPCQDQTKETFPKTPYKKMPHKLSKSALVTFVMSVAAILFVALLLRFGPVPRVQVATVTGGINAAFADGEPSTVGSRLSSGTNSLWLQKGIIEITFDYGARVIIEAPAQFNLNSAENIALNSGRLYAHVPQRSKGFMVETPSSRVIDLGTEFGVKVDFDGSSDVYMMKGKASVFSGSRGQTGQGQILTAGDARRVDSKGTMEVIPMRQEDFAREFLTGQSIAWRGQDIDLADIIGGGCGFGTGYAEYQIDPVTGQMGPWELVQERYGKKGYVPVRGSMFIDGVFVPDGGEGPVQVTSTDRQWDCPDTLNSFKYNIVSSLHIPDNPEQYDYPGIEAKSDQMLKKAIDGNVPVQLMGFNAMKTPSEPTDTSLFIHANLGITFDLNEMRRLLPNARITNFKSVFGLGGGFYGLEKVDPDMMNVDVWILVDGQPRLFRQDMDGTVLMDIDVELSETDRFLTLVVTDSADNGDQYGYAFDWGLFMNPRLEVK